ncbi:MAG: GIY-YIG nuclease family protein [Metallosphaera sp.]
MKHVKGYVIIFECNDGVITKGKRRFSIERGTYAYVGSCGVNCSKRISRHLNQRVEKRHWHVDYLKDICKPLAAFILDKDEEEIADSFTDEVIGFGASDCNKHKGHLYRAKVDELRRI